MNVMYFLTLQVSQLFVYYCPEKKGFWRCYRASNNSTHASSQHNTEYTRPTQLDQESIIINALDYKKAIDWVEKTMT